LKTVLSAALLVLAAHQAYAVDIYHVTISDVPDNSKIQRGEKDAQLYGGATYGASYVDFDCTPIPNCKHEDTGYKLYSGFNITAHIAAELGYVGFGKGTAETVRSGFLLKHQQAVSALVLNGAFRIDMTRNATGIVRLGLARVRAKASGSIAGVPLSDTETSVAPYLGLGLEYAVADNLKAIAAVDFTKSEIDDEKSDARLISLGLQYGF
jgi:OOP family OmpA-OmpF porin